MKAMLFGLFIFNENDGEFEEKENKSLSSDEKLL